MQHRGGPPIGKDADVRNFLFVDHQPVGSGGLRTIDSAEREGVPECDRRLLRAESHGGDQPFFLADPIDNGVPLLSVGVGAAVP